MFDPVRGKSVRALPEEQVRQQLVAWLLRDVGVPARLVAVEYSLSMLEPRCRKRADVVAWRPSSAGGLSPWLLAECKAPGVALTERVADQVRGYAALVRAEHVLVTNGAETRCFTAGAARYVPVDALPRFPRAAPPRSA